MKYNSYIIYNNLSVKPTNSNILINYIAKSPLNIAEKNNL